MELEKFSKKQQQVLTWWQHSKYGKYYGIIGDGAVRSGKTFSMTFGFLLWSMSTFNDRKFAICGKTIHTVTKNIVKDFVEMCKMIGFSVKYNRSQNRIVVTGKNSTNEYFIYGGGNEQSQDLIQGMTLAGILFDEVALMKESFVNQATARCSITGSKFWFNCNPDSPKHFFKTDWIDKKDEKKLFYIHFKMNDNLTNSKEILEQYEARYAGSFYDRYINGLWTAGHGVIYDMFNKGCIVEDDEEIPSIGTHYISVDYGTKNATAFLRIVETRNCSYVIDEYYYDGRKKEKTKTNAEYCEDLIKFCDKDKRPHCVLIDPSAASFKAELRGKIVVKDADNTVLDGIRLVASMLSTGRLKIHSRCENTLNEFYSYVWKENKTDKEEPLKENDHCMDALRYYMKTIVKK